MIDIGNPFYFDWEIKFSVWLRGTFNGSILDWIFFIISIICDSGLIWYILAVILFCFKKTRLVAIVALFNLLFLTGINDFIVKTVVSRARPFYSQTVDAYPEASIIRDFVFSNFKNGSGIGEIPNKGSFMSGHTISSIAFSVAVVFKNRKVGIPLVVFALLVSFSRIYLGVHFVTDVLAGLAYACIFSIGLSILYWFVVKKIGNRIKNKKEVVA
ncbi:MAG: phosphatase PAP2 family protein [Acholeplasmatales bacterium]|jgi:undecaprenyl-diphosphatase|nr:phosphatase PAP2 family protein [Acholeplasmatales bacterium]